MELLYAQDSMEPGFFSGNSLRAFDKISVTDATTRQFTQDGFLKVKAVLTRPGDIKYSRKELKKPGTGWVTVFRRPESVGAVETLRSMDGAPVTMGHPPGGVTPLNSSKHVVGTLTNPRLMEDGMVQGEITIWNQKAIKDLQNGQDDVSIGYDFHLDWKDPFYAETVGPMRVNHVAIVNKGRAGKSVRVMDSLDKTEEGKMDEDYVDALAERIASQIDGEYDPEDVREMVRAELANAVRVNDSRDKAAEYSARIAEAARQEERTRHRLMMDAMPLLSHRPDVQRALPNMEAREILLHTVGDSVDGDPDDYTDERLMGRFEALRDLYANELAEEMAAEQMAQEGYGDEYYDDGYDGEYYDEPMYATDSMPEGAIGPYYGVDQAEDEPFDANVLLNDTLADWDKIRAEEYVAHGGC